MTSSPMRERDFVQVLARGCFFFVAMFLWWHPLPAQQIRVNPAKIEVTLEQKITSGSLEVTSLVGAPVRYRVSALHWIFDEYNRLKIIPPDSNSIATWMKFNPREFEIDSGQTQVVRYTIIRPQSVRDGEYWAGIQFEPLKYDVYHAVDSSGSGSRATVRVLISFFVPIYAQVGAVERAGEISEFRIYKGEKADILSAIVRNTGKGILRLKGGLRLSSLDSINTTAETSVGPVMVFPGRFAEIRVPLAEQPAPGHYSVLVHLKDEKSSLEISAEGETEISNSHIARKEY